MRLALLLLALSFALAARAAEIVLLRSDSSAAFFKASGGDYALLLNPWRSLFRRNAIAARELRAAELASVKSPAVLVLASAVALSEAERAAIRARLAQGWSVLGTWASGVRDARGSWLGYGFVEETFGVKVLADAPAPGRDDSFLVPFGETPLTHALPAGQRIYLSPAAEKPVRVRSPGTAARVSTYAREVRPPATLLGAAAFDERAGARRAYFGFAETSWTGAHLADIDALVVGTLEWLQRKPIVVKSAWPHPYEAALLLEMDTEDKFGNALVFAEQLERAGLRGTFYLLTSEALKHPQVVERLAARHEIACHGEVHHGFAGVDPREQEARLRAMIADMAKLGLRGAGGFRPPLEEYDASTERLARALGLRHLAGSPDSSDAALPRFSSAEPGLGAQEALVILPRTWLDDINLVRLALLEKDSAAAVLLASLEATLAMRGFGLLSVHTQNFAPGGALERAMPRLLEALAARRERVWAAPAGSIERWWRGREAVQVSARREARALRVGLQAAAPVEGLRLVLFPPGAQAPRLEGAPRGARLERLDAHRWALVLPALPKGPSELRVAF